MLSNPETVAEILQQKITKVEMGYYPNTDISFLKDLLKVAKKEREELETLKEIIYLTAGEDCEE